jgi:hypothetical protein
LNGRAPAGGVGDRDGIIAAPMTTRSRAGSGGSTGGRGGTRRGGAGSHSKPATSRRAPAEPRPRATDPQAARASGLGGLLRTPGVVFGQISGIDGPAKSLDRLAESVERALDYVDRIDDEVGIENLARLALRLEAVADALEGRGRARDGAVRLLDTLTDMHRSLLQVEAVVIDLHERVALTTALVRNPLRRRRRRADDAGS